MRVADAAALVVTVSGLVVMAIAAFIGAWRMGLKVAVDLWLAAGLLRLGFEPDFDRLAPAAAIVAVRQVVGIGLRISGSVG